MHGIGTNSLGSKCRTGTNCLGNFGRPEHLAAGPSSLIPVLCYTRHWKHLMMKLGSVWFFQNRPKGKLLQSSGIFRDMLNKKSYTCTCISKNIALCVLGFKCNKHKYKQWILLIHERSFLKSLLGPSNLTNGFPWNIYFEFLSHYKKLFKNKQCQYYVWKRKSTGNSWMRVKIW